MSEKPNETKVKKTSVPMRVRLAAQDVILKGLDAITASEVSDAVAAEVGAQKARVRRLFNAEDV